MKKILVLLVFCLLGLSNCKKILRDKAEVTLVFHDDIVLPSYFFDFNKNEESEYNQIIKDFNKIMPAPLDASMIDDIKNHNDFGHLIPQIKQFREKSKKKLGKSFIIRPIFELNDMRSLYGKIRDAKIIQDSTTATPIVCSNMVSLSGKNKMTNINNAVTLGCLSEGDYEKIKDLLVENNLSNLATLDYAQHQKKSSIKDFFKTIFKSEDNRGVTEFADCKKQKNIQWFRNTMGIESLQANTFDSTATNGKKHSIKFKGKNANLILVETAGIIDKNHFKFKDLPKDTWQKQESLGYGSNKNHSTFTFGVIFSNDKNKNSREINCTNGIATEANIRKIIYHSDGANECTDRSKTIYGAILKAVLSSQKGDILLFEEQIRDGNLTGIPLEMAPISRNLIFICTNILGVTVIEPIGEKTQEFGTDFDKEVEYKRAVPAKFEGILVSAAVKDGSQFVKAFGLNDSKTHIDCFGLDHIQTTAYGDKFAYYGQSSAAAAQIAGLVLVIQGYYYTSKGCYLSPQEMKNLFRNTKRTNSNKVKGFQQVIPDAMQLKSEVDKLIARQTP